MCRSYSMKSDFLAVAAYLRDLEETAIHHREETLEVILVVTRRHFHLVDTCRWRSSCFSPPLFSSTIFFEIFSFHWLVDEKREINESLASNGTNQTNYLEGLSTHSRSARSKDVLWTDRSGWFLLLLRSRSSSTRDEHRRACWTQEIIWNMLMEFFSSVAEKKKKKKKETRNVFSCLCLLFIRSLMSFRCPIWLFACYVFFLLFSPLCPCFGASFLRQRDAFLFLREHCQW